MKKITLANLDDSSAQEVFDYVACHLLVQNARATERPMGASPTPGCVYLSPEGLKCAAGVLLGDDYNPRMEGNTWASLVDFGSVPDTRHTALVQALQGVHDNTPPVAWPHELDNIAGDWHLKWRGVEALKADEPQP